MTSRGVTCCCRPVYSLTEMQHPPIAVSMSNILMNRTRSQIIRFLLRNGPATRRQIGDGVGASPSSVRRQLGILRDAGLVKGSAGQFAASPHQVHLQIEAFASNFQTSSCCSTSLLP